MPACKTIYRPRDLTDSALWKILRNHCEDFKAVYDEHCEKQYGFFQPRPGRGG